MCSVVGLGTIGILGAVLVAGVPAQSAIDVSPGSGRAGTQVTITQTDFDPAEGPCIIASATLGGDGVDTTSGGPGVATFAVPDGAASGEQSVTATCEGGAPAGTAQFTVIGETTTTEEPSDPTTTETTAGDSPDTTQRGADGGPPATRPPTTPTTALPVPESIDECEEQAAAAESKLVYEPERQMTVGDTYEVRAALSLDDLPPDVTFGSPTTVVEVPDARCTIEAVLTGPDFDVSPDEPVAQSFVGTRVLVWEWEVSPTRPGQDRELTVRLQASVVEGGRSVPGRTILSETVIDVDARPQSLWNRLSGWLRDLFGHPIVPVVVVPALGAAVVALRRRMRDDEPPTAPTGPAPVRR
jgi:hypothetical protein